MNNKTLNIKIIFICISFFLLSCKLHQNKKEETNNNKFDSIKKNLVSKSDTILLNKITGLKKSECPCKLIKKNGRHKFTKFKNSLIDQQKELVVKICENGNNQFALSLESWNGFDKDKKIPRGKIYDYKVLTIKDEDYVAFSDELCTLKATGEKLIFIQLSKGIHSVWRIKKGKFVELDKNKEYPCIDYEELNWE